MNGSLQFQLLFFILVQNCNSFVILFKPTTTGTASAKVSSTLITLANKQPENDATNDDLQWRIEKVRLEEQNKREFLKRKPRKLPYRDARRWVQANLGPDSAEEFFDLVENGNLRTPYIPKRPDEYYTESGDWISWDHFLTGVFEEEASGIFPPTGKFD